MAPLRVLVSGAGIGGNAVAFWLSKLGHEVTVVERFPVLRVNGLQIDLRGHGIEVMKRMGLESAFRSHAAPEQGLQVVDKKGKRRAYFPATKSGQAVQSITSEFEIMRRDLCQIMYDVTKDRTKYLFDTSIESFEEKQDGLEVRLTGGRVEQFDLLIGADGQGSRTRRMMLGSDTPDRFYPTGECVAYFTIALPIKEGEEYVSSLYTATGSRSVMTRRHTPDRMQVYLISKEMSARLKNITKGDVKQEKQAFTDFFQGAGWEVDTILKAMKETDDFYCERQGLVKLESWSKGRVTLVGDAGYCPTSDIGMGTTSAMLGAYVLAGEIGRHCGSGGDSRQNTKSDIAAALQAYEDNFRPFMAQIQKGVGEPSIFDKIPWTSFTVGVFNRFAWMASILRLDLVAGWFLHHKVAGWDLPEYETMVKCV